MQIYGISYSRFCSLEEHYHIYSIQPRVHGNNKKRPSNILPKSINKDLRLFISNDVEQNTILLPGKIPGNKNGDIKLLSSSETKATVQRSYSDILSHRKDCYELYRIS